MDVNKVIIKRFQFSCIVNNLVAAQDVQKEVKRRRRFRMMWRICLARWRNLSEAFVSVALH